MTSITNIPYATIKSVVSFSANSVKDLLEKRKLGSMYLHYIDHEAYDLWVKVLSEKEIETYLNATNEYVGHQALTAKQYYQRLTPQERIDKGLPTNPGIMTFDFDSYFVNRKNPQLDGFFVKRGFVNVISKSITALSNACLFGTIDEVKFLLENNANPNPQIDFKEQPLFKALRRFDQYKKIAYVDEVADLLLAKGSDLLIRDPKTGNTLLHMMSALDRNRNEEIAYLVEKGININSVNNNGETPLYLACENFSNHDENGNNYEELLNLDADPNIPDRRGAYPIRIVIDRLHSSYEWLSHEANEDEREFFELEIEERRNIISDLIASGAKRDVPGTYGPSLFYEIFDIDTLFVLFDKKHPSESTALINKVDLHGETVLSRAYHFSEFKAVLWLLEHNADPNFKYDTEPAIFDVIVKLITGEKDKRDLYMDIVKEMLRNKNVLLSKNTNGENVLSRAMDYIPLFDIVVARYIQTGNVKLLDEQDKDGKTLLMKVVEGYKPEQMKILVKAGVNIHLVDKKFRTARDLIKTQGMLALYDNETTKKHPNAIPTEELMFDQTYQTSLEFLRDKCIPSQELFGDFLTKAQLMSLANKLDIQMSQSFRKQQMINFLIEERNIELSLGND
jgi:ankyrin repeat protein